MMVHMALGLPKSATNYAGYEQRLYACAIDMLLLIFVSVLLRFSQNGILVLLTQAGYFIFCWYRFSGKTLGNKMMKIRVVSEDEKAITLKQASIRYGGFLLSEIVFFVGFLWIFWNKKRQGWHDKMAKTMVIKS